MKTKTKIIKINAGKGCGKGCTLISVDEKMQTNIKVNAVKQAA